MSEGIRAAQKKDLQAMLGIYAPYVENTAVTFEYDIPSIEEFENRFQKITDFFPWLVYEEDSKVLGYAYAGTFHERKAFQWDAELSIYLSEEAHRRGIGKKLYSELFSILEEQGIYTLYAHITYPNDDSIAFHKAMGFQKIAHFPKTGYKMGKWRDTIFMEKHLKELPDFPQQPHSWKEQGKRG
ncbi:MAG: GNAT family N-acetyltransferase [Eubacteriales bacterium]|nr:GNAT family N-acetyltransferase [Eubacteriales bacterium]